MTYLSHAELHLFYALQLSQPTHALPLLRYVMTKLGRNSTDRREVQVFLTLDETGTHKWYGNPGMIRHWRQGRNPHYMEVAGPNDNTDGFRHNWPKHIEREARDVAALETSFESRTDILTRIAHMDRDVFKNAALPRGSILTNAEIYKYLLKEAYVVTYTFEKPPVQESNAETDVTVASTSDEEEAGFDRLEENHILKSAAARRGEAAAKALGPGGDADKGTYMFWLKFLSV
ncbi:hypothetical protein OHC33_001488 [Knufia fluminis]|uniref:Uncharacterized protein n=1 Tax=Knufia fluminis TaxID=191047 RepID=A0AAN8EJ85_9EURO|nr:hypothetical protein OHC33_001488 [Knufia fluminis]